MTVIAVTSWEGTPEAIENLIKGSKASAPIHGAQEIIESYGRWWNGYSFYSIEFKKCIWCIYR